MKVYIVGRFGVYMQGVLGAYGTLAEAVQRAKDACAAEPDDYHKFYVYGMELGESVDFGSGGEWENNDSDSGWVWSVWRHRDVLHDSPRDNLSPGDTTP